MTLAEIAEKVGGVLEGEGDVEITGVAALSDAGSGDISFLSSPRYASQVAGTGASAVVVAEDWSGECSCPVIRVGNPDKAFADVAAEFAPEAVAYEPGVHGTAVVAADAVLGEGVSIGPHCVVEPGAEIGDRTVICAGCYIGHGSALGAGCKLYPRVTVRERVTIGDRAILHPGVVIGSDGFGYVLEGPVWKKIPQVGTVEIGNDVEIGANSTVDRGRFGKTVIEDGVKLDNLVQVAHNVRIGKNSAAAAQVGISGSTTIGHNVMLGGQAGIAGHLTVGDRAAVGAKAGVTKSVPAEMFVSDYPARPHKQAKKIHAHVARLPELKEKVKQLEKRISDLFSSLCDKEQEH